ncbi:MAG: YkgJ family cysteine cluster protein [Pseudomonadota bacterium]|nr:YkgJ family cysteine cluster protein [Pseudomonadota bacterium]
MECRAGCGACCIVPAIHTPFHGMPNGKGQGERCEHLDDNWLCGLFGDPRRPACCSQFQAEVAFCGSSREEALQLLTELEVLSDPKGA